MKAREATGHSTKQSLFRRLRDRSEWKFFGVLPKVDRTLAVVWWVVLVLPALFAIAMGR
jgi:hypothetical protein